MSVKNKPSYEDIKRSLEANNTAISEETTARQTADTDLQEQIDTLVAASDVVDVVGTYADLQSYDTSKLTDRDVVKVLSDSTHDNARSYYRWVITEGTGAWSYVGSEPVSYTKTEEDTLLANKLDKMVSVPSVEHTRQEIFAMLGVKGVKFVEAMLTTAERPAGETSGSYLFLVYHNDTTYGTLLAIRAANGNIYRSQLVNGTWEDWEKINGGGSGSGLAKEFVTEFPAEPAEDTLYFKLKQDMPDINFIDRPTATPTYTYYSLAIPDLLSYNESTGCWSMTFDGVTSNPFPASIVNATTVGDLASQGMIAESSASGAILKVDKSKPYNIAIPLNSSGQEMTIPDIVYMKGTTDNILGIDEASQIIYNVDMPSQLNFALNETDANTYNERFEGMFFPNDPRQVFIQPCTKEEAKVLFFNNKIVKNLTTDEMSISSGYVYPNSYGFVYDTTKILNDGELVEVELKKDLEKLIERVNNKVEKTRKINNKPLTSDVNLTLSDFGLANINTPTFGNYTGQALSTLLTNSRVGEKLIWSYKFQASASPTGSADDEWIIRIIRHNASGYNLLVIAYNLNNYNSIYMNRYTGGAWGSWRKVNA